MTDEASEPNELEMMIARLRARIEKLKTAVIALEALRGEDVGSAAPTGNVPQGLINTASDAPAETIHSSLFRAMSIADAAIMLLKKRDRPMKNPEIARELRAGGLIMNSAQPVNTVGAVLLRRSQQTGDILRTSEGEWVLKAWTRYAKSPKVKGALDLDESAEDDSLKDP